ncbi:hypothetical protein CASFOL_037538 [Castilleja foliolosa]|uniref:Ribulose bisphosphate carboxylase large chain n=1 Tax=Castilleja foliolosa TaxID=1961234 RepID=A0ABD3BLX1_9LAMI
MSCREGFMSPQTETKASVGFKAGDKEFKLTYYTPEYQTKDTDILAAFRVSPQPGVPPEEAGVAVAAESSTGTWTTVWTDGLTSLDRYKGRCYHIEPVPGKTDQYICYVAYPLDLFEEALRALPIYKAQAETGEIKGHYLNATAGTCEEMIKRAIFARELGVPIIEVAVFISLKIGSFYQVLFPVASGGIHVWHMPALTEIFGDDSVLQFGGGTLGHPWVNAPGAVANRVALEACVQARNEGRDLAAEGNAIIREASKWSPELAAACERARKLYGKMVV